MAVFKRGKKWWYKFFWNGEPIRESTKQSNKRTAEQMEATHKASLAKGEVGIREKKPVPTLEKFLENDFLPFVRSTQGAKVQVSTVNRDLATLRRGFHLAAEWGKVSTILPRVRLLAGENHRERVLTPGEERKYLDAATAIGHGLSEGY